MTGTVKFSPDYIVLPGETILEMLEANSMTQKDLSARMGITEKTVCEIIKGKSPITQNHAKSLELILGLPSSFWLNLQRNYEDALYAEKHNKELDEQTEIAECFPQETLKKMGFLPKGRNKGVDLVEKLLEIFKVRNLNQVLGLYDINYNCRISNTSVVDEYALATWMRLGELEVENNFEYKEIPVFNAEKVKQSIEELREINMHTDPSVFLKELEKTCYELGIMFVVIPEIKGSRISGMARWKTVGKRKIPMIQLSLRGKKHDMFWFTFFHELAHILLHHEDDGEFFVDIFEGERNLDLKENEADDFSKNTLIPQKKYEKLTSDYISRGNIMDLSSDINIHPGIIVGRLQKEGFLKWNQLHDLKVTYKWDFEK